MEDKKSFILYSDLIHTVSKMPSDKAGELLMHILKYVNDEDPQTDDLIINLTFEPIKQQLKRDLNKWKGKKETQSEKGREGNLKRWSLDVYKDYKEGIYTLEEAEVIAKDRKISPPDETRSGTVASVAVNDNVNVNVNVNDSVNVIKKNNKDIPTYSDFLSHAISKIHNVCPNAVKLKYESWVENSWKDGNNNKITNWKSKLTNTVGYLNTVKNDDSKYFVNSSGNKILKGIL